jgi:uncharacterized protein DUF3987
MKSLQSMTPGQATVEQYEEVCVAVTSLPGKNRPPALFSAIARAFGRSLPEVQNTLRVRERAVDFDALIPDSGWIREYIEWTRKTEPPTVFHFFCASVAIGATLGRKVFFDKGAYQVYPNLCVMLIAPSGRCRKTSAANLSVSLYSKAGGSLLADKSTPEALIDALKEQANALIYAAELSAFLGKQKYNEGMIPLLTALFDCPEEFVAKTIGRGSTTLTGVALSSIMCSTLDWLQTGIPSDAFGGGFMSRFLFVVQESTDRCFPIPPPLDKEIKANLIYRLAGLRNVHGEVRRTKTAEDWYDHWYRTRATIMVSGERQFAGYYERKPDHILRLAIIMKLAVDPKDMIVTETDLIAAERILTWLESFLPRTFDQLTSSAVGEDQTRLIRHLRQAGGVLEHSVLLRKNSSRLNAEQFKRAIQTLREARIVDWDATTKSYILTPEGWQ